MIAFAASMVWTASQVFSRFESIENTALSAYDNSLENEDDIQSIQVRLATIETKLDEGFRSLEKLIRKNK